MSLQIIVPQNNPQLGDRLETTVLPSSPFIVILLMYRSIGLHLPILYHNISLSILWDGVKKVDLESLCSSRTLDGADTILTIGTSNKAINTDQDVRNWVITLRPKATILNVKPRVKVNYQVLMFLQLF